MAPHLTRISFRELRFGVIANSTATINRDPDAAPELLLEQITAPVRWAESMRLMIDSGVTQAVEFGPGRVLAGLLRRIDRSVKVLATEDSASLRATMSAIARS
jgi:[acyl-carrier-protein] S-malonyltransferase